MPIQLIYDQMFGHLPSDKCCVLQIDQELLVCSLSGQKLTDPVVASDGYTYQREIIEEFFNQRLNKNNVMSPKSGEVLLVDNDQKLILNFNYIIQRILQADNVDLCDFLNNYLSMRNSITYYHKDTGFFENKLLHAFVEDFRARYFKLYEVNDLEIRNIFKLLSNNERLLVKYILSINSNLAFKPLTDSGGEYLLHFFAALNDFDMIKFLVQELNVPIDQKSAVHGFYISFYLKGAGGIEILDYCLEKELSLSLVSNNKKIDLLIHGIKCGDLQLIRHIFTKGFLIKDEEEYLNSLQDILVLAPYEIIIYVAGELQKYPHIMQSLSFIHKLSKNHVLTEEQFAELFLIFGGYLQDHSRLYANPYCLGVLRRNIRYLIVLHQYWEYAQLAPIIDLPANNNHDLPLQLAIDNNIMQVVELLLFWGANPNIKYKEFKSYPLSRALLNDNVVLFRILRNYRVDIQGLLVLEIIPALLSVKSFDIDDLIFILRGIDREAFKTFFQRRGLLTSGIMDNNNLLLLSALGRAIDVDYTKWQVDNPWQQNMQSMTSLRRGLS